MADGGIEIVKISDLKQNWEQIKFYLDFHFNDSEENQGLYDGACPRIKDAKAADVFLAALPDSIQNCSGEEIIEILQPLGCCDTPYLLGEYVIFSSGDNLSDLENVMSNVLGWVYIGDLVTTWS